MFDYPTLRIIWWALLGILLIGFAVTDGFDLGSAILSPFVSRTDLERRIVINSIGPVWEGNQVWFILAGGATFAAWPYLYAVSFSSFYLAMCLVLASLILRPVTFKYRSKVDAPRWRQIWDIIFFITGFVPSLIFGVAIGNVIQGIPFYFDETLRSFYTGSFWQLLNPFALLCGFVSISMFSLHGGLYLAVKTEDPIRERAIHAARISGMILIILFALGGIWIATGIKGYSLTTALSHAGPSNPLHKTVMTGVGIWLNNFQHYPSFILAPILGFLGALFAILLARFGDSKFAFCFSALSISGIIATFGLSIYPFILPSTTHPNMSLLIWDASSSQLTLFIMLIATLLLLPIILLYTAWVYRVMRGKITLKQISAHEKEMY